MATSIGKRPAIARAPRSAPPPRRPEATEPPTSVALGGDGKALPRWAPVGTAALVGLVAFVAYLLTLQRSVPTGDSGELITAAHVLGVAHPPGYPLYTMLGHVVGWLPFGSVALRMNLLSALLDAATVSVVFLVVYRLVVAGGRATTPAMRPWTPLVAAATGALLLAFSSTFWEYSVVAEVFPLNNLFAAVLLLVALEWVRRPESSRLLWLFAFLFGLALTNQQTIITFVPAFLVLTWAGVSALRRASGEARRLTGDLRLRDVAIACGLFLAGLLPYLYLPLAARRNPVVNWGDPTTLDRFREVVTRSHYGSLQLVAGGKKGSILENIGLLAANVTLGFVVVGIALTGLGLWWTGRERRATGIALALAFLVAGPVFVAYANTYFPDDLTKGVLARFYILPRIPLAILAGAGAWQVLVWAQRARRPVSRPALVTLAAAVALLAVPVASAVVHYGAADQSSNDVARNYGHDLLDSLEPDALLLMRSDENLTSVSYAQFVEHVRPDVIALDTELLKLPSYVEKARREHPGVVIPFDSYDGGATTKLAQVVEANLAQRPVYAVGGMEEKDFESGFDAVAAGMTKRLLPKGTEPDQRAQLREQTRLVSRLRFPSRSYPSTTWEQAIAESYGSTAFNLAFALQRLGDPADVAVTERMYRTSIRLAGAKIPSAYKNLGVLLNETRSDKEELIRVWERFLELEPDNPQAGQIRAAVERLKAEG